MNVLPTGMNGDPVIDGIAVDVEGLCGIAHSCRPGLCRGRVSCCASFEVCVAGDEVPGILGLLPIAAELAPHLMTNGSLDNPFDSVGDGLYAIDTDEEGLCRFAYRLRDGRTLCSLHSAAVRLGLRPQLEKPFSCALWPLAMSEGRPRVLTVHEGAFEFPCNRRRRARASIHAGIAAIIEELFGRVFLQRLVGFLGP